MRLAAQYASSLDGVSTGPSESKSPSMSPYKPPSGSKSDVAATVVIHTAIPVVVLPRDVARRSPQHGRSPIFPGEGVLRASKSLRHLELIKVQMRLFRRQIGVVNAAWVPDTLNTCDNIATLEDPDWWCLRCDALPRYAMDSRRL